MELQIDDAGAVRAATPQRWSPLPEDILTPALSRWQFRPATIGRRSVPARVMVTVVFRPPVLFNTLTPGSPPKVLAQASPDVPFPIDAPAARISAACCRRKPLIANLRPILSGRLCGDWPPKFSLPCFLRHSWLSPPRAELAHRGPCTRLVTRSRIRRVLTSLFWAAWRYLGEQ